MDDLILKKLNLSQYGMNFIFRLVGNQMTNSCGL